MGNEATRSFYEDSYRTAGFDAQRRYPNEELCRFMGRNFFKVPYAQRKKIRILEVGCGSGANLWMIAREGFDAYGLDLSEESLTLCEEMLSLYNVRASLKAVDMASLPYEDGMFDAVVDVFSSYCLDENTHKKFVAEVARTLRPGGLYFSYTPSKASNAFTDHAPATLLDGSTLDGIRRATSPYAGNLYPFRFTTNAEYAAVLESEGFRITSNEKVAKTYKNGAEYFEFVVVEGRLPP